ncbi:proton-coupled folate transporter-like [Argopecten irradians]|uniref:proton-coupled folate transporter-like n=1 Tax=Argopecten irradians TaxID=31199 RepID=UPI00371DA225
MKVNPQKLVSHSLGPTAGTNKDEGRPLNGYKQTQTSGLLLRYFLMILFAIGFSTFLLCKSQFIYKRISDDRSGSSLNKSAVTCGEINGSVAEDESQTEAASLTWRLSMVQMAVSIPMIVLLGTYSDIIGRKYCLLISFVCNALLYGCTCLVAALDLPLGYLYVGYALSGLGGAHFNLFATLSASIADLTVASKSRSLSFAILYFSAGVGLSSSQLAEGYIIKLYGFVWPLGFASVIVLLGAVIIFLFFKNEIPIKSSGIKDILSNMKVFFSGKEKYKRAPKWVFIVSIIGMFLFYSPNDNRVDLETLLQLRSPFCWDSQYVGWYQSGESAVHMLAGPLLMMILQKFYSDETIAVAGLLSGMLFYLLFAVASSDWMIYAGAALGILMMAVPACLKASLSKMVPSDFQGSLFACIYLMSVFSTMTGSTIFNNIYANTQTSMHGLTFLVMAGFNLVAIFCIISVIAFKKSDRGLQIASNISNINV